MGLFDGELIDIDSDGKNLDYIDLDFEFEPGLKDMTLDEINAIRANLKQVGIEFEGFDE